MRQISFSTIGELASLFLCLVAADATFGSWVFSILEEFDTEKEQTIPRLKCLPQHPGGKYREELIFKRSIPQINIFKNFRTNFHKNVVLRSILNHLFHQYLHLISKRLIKK